MSATPPTTVQIVGSRMSAARQCSPVLTKRTKAAVAALVGADVDTVARWEAQGVRMRREDAERVASALGFGLAFLLTEPRAQPSPHFRSPSTAGRVRESSGGYAHIASDLLNEIETSVGLPPVNLPVGRPTTSGPVPYQTKVAISARSLREHWHLGAGPIANLATTVERNSIPILLLAVDGVSIRGFTAWANGRPAIVVNSLSSRDPYEIRFTVAHELGHILLGHDHEALPDDNEEQRSVIVHREREANLFAAEFLMPSTDRARSEVLAALRSPYFSGFLSAKEAWGMPVHALLRRAVELGLLSPDEFERRMRAYRSQKWHTVRGEPGRRKIPEFTSLMSSKLRELDEASPGAVLAISTRTGLPSSIVEQLSARLPRPLAS